MKIRTGFVSNSSSSSFVPMTDRSAIDEFLERCGLEMDVVDDTLVIERDGKPFGEVTIEDVAFFVNFIRNSRCD